MNLRGKHPQGRDHGEQRFFARVVRGLEDLVAGDITERFRAKITRVDHRTVHFRSSQSFTELVTLRSVDDLFLTVGEIAGIDHTRAALETIAQGVSSLPWEHTLDQLEPFRPLAAEPTFSITASFVGKRNFTRWDVAEVVRDAIGPFRGWRFLDPRGSIGAVDRSVRIQLEGGGGVVGLRLASAPLSKRSYRHTQMPGALPPQVAFIMARLSGAGASGAVLDPFCGIGTIPLEVISCAPEATVVGSDIEDLALKSFSESCRDLSRAPLVIRADAFKLPLLSASIDAVVTDPPWGRTTLLVHREVCEPCGRMMSELSRVLRPGGRLVILTSDEEHTLADAGGAGFRLFERYPLRLSGASALLMVFENQKK